MKIGFIGLGDQGGPMAEMILKAGLELTVWARRPEVLPHFASLGAKTADSPAALAASVDVLCLCVVSGDDVEQIVYEGGALAAMPRGSVLVIHSTIDPEVCLKIGRDGSARDVHVIDAPVSGMGVGALAGTLVVMLGGDEDSIARTWPMYETYSNCIVPLGPLGSAQRAKAINNMLLAANVELAYQALTLGEQMGIDLDGLMKCLTNSTGRSFVLPFVFTILSDPVGREQAATLLGKDVALAAANARAFGADPEPLERVARAMLHRIDERRQSEEPCSS